MEEDNLPRTSEGKVDLEVLYPKRIKPVVKSIVMGGKSRNDYSFHHYAGELKKGGKTVAKKVIRHVRAEIRGMKTSLPVFFGSSVILRADKARPYVMQAIIFAPHDTPYDSGCFLFDIYCPPTYPSAPPKVNLQTTGAGSVRFNPNLYNTGKVCLSLLGTWHGGSRAEEWNEDSTLLQVFVSIQALIFIKYPYYNEPGFEGQQGTPEGERQQRTAQNGGYERLRVGTVQWAMVDQLKHPPKGFEDIVRTHFLLKRAHILKTVRGWLKEAKDSDTAGHYKALKTQVDKLVIELRKLGPSPCDEYEEEEAPPEPKIDPKLVQEVLAILPFYTKEQAAAALEANSKDVAAAINHLLSTGQG